MITCMRTTIVIDDGLLREAKRRAAKRGITVSQLIDEALRQTLAQRVEAAPRFEAITYGAGAPPVHREPDDLARALEEDDRASVGP